MSLAFDTSDDSPARLRTRQPAAPSWLHAFSATFAAVLLAGVVLLVGVRFYVYWSINDTLKDKAPVKVK